MEITVTLCGGETHEVSFDNVMEYETMVDESSNAIVTDSGTAITSAQFESVQMSLTSSESFDIDVEDE